MHRLRIVRTGNGLAVLLPPDVVAKLGIAEGGHLFLVETKDGIELLTEDGEVARQLEAGEKIMDQYRNTLRELAKGPE